MSDFYSKITAPIDGGDPFGADVNYDLDYERLKGEMGKLGDIDAEVVESLSFKILTGKSKDVRALAFLSYAMLRMRDFGRLADVFCALAAYCRDNFERVYPRREAAKVAALRWFSEARFGGQCEKTEAGAADVDGAGRLAEAVLALRTALGERFSDRAPPLSILYKKAVEWKKSAESAASGPAAPIDEPPVAGAGGTKSVSNGAGTGRGQDSADGDEYDEILRCVKKIEAFITNLKRGPVA